MAQAVRDFQPAYVILLFMLIVTGCASMGGPRNVPPEFHQKVQLITSGDYKQFQAPSSSYDLGDLQSFQSQHIFPIKVQHMFEEIFDKVEIIEPGARLETGQPEVPAIFEVQMVDLAHDLYDENVDSFRGHVVLAAAMKSPRGQIFWQQGFRGHGFVQVDQEFGFKVGPEQAVIDAVQDALNQLQDAILKSPQIRLQLKQYQAIEDARRKEEVPI